MTCSDSHQQHTHAAATLAQGQGAAKATLRGQPPCMLN
jgi:hypothetical protein